MRSEDGKLLLSATDLSNQVACRHLTQLDRAVAEGDRKAPAWRDPSLALLQERGLAHERAYLDHLRGCGVPIVDLREFEGDTAAKRTRSAMRDGVEAVAQAALEDGRWSGRADVLLRVEEPSALGAWSYEVVDTKLAQQTRGGTILQLCLYSELVARVQGRVPDHMHVVKPSVGYARETFRVADFQAYFRLVRARLEATARASPSGATYPHPVPQCEICRWWQECDARRHSDDHLSLVAGLPRLHIGELQRQGVRTLAQFADEPAPLRERPKRGTEETYAKAQGQARIQLAGKKAGKLLHELLPVEPGLGLARLPEPCEGDVFFDIESDPFVEGGGLEYLLGYASVAGGPSYRALWGLDRRAERRAFETFIDALMARWREHPGMHVYHFSPYEPAALKRLVGRHATRAEELDRLLRGDRFVDLLAVTRRGLRASVESYSLKELEHFCGFARGVELRAASVALRCVSAALERVATNAIAPADLEIVEGYNREDCLATAALRDWLEARRAELEARGAPIARPELKTGEASERITSREGEAEALFERLTAGLPEDRAAWAPDESARWLLAHQLEYFRREERCAWWEHFRIHDLRDEELLEERKAITGLVLVGDVPARGRTPVHRYRFPAQEAAIDPGDELYEVGGAKVGTVHAIDQADRILDIKKRGNSSEVHPTSVMVNEVIPSEALERSLWALARTVAEHGVDGTGPYRAARDLLLRSSPRLHGGAGRPLRRSGELAKDAAVRLARELDCGVLAIQGPPGSGKTTAGAAMIAALAAGKRVGVTALSHKVIRKLLEDALRAAPAQRLRIRAVHKVKERSKTPAGEIVEVTDNDRALAAVGAGTVVGGTAWLWARDDMAESLDYLFVDEAGQLSLAHTLSAARAAKNVILLGDPQQLEQPQRGAHPEGAEVAALVHMLGGRPTIADDAGLFLDETWRLHPRICALTSELFYEGRLRSGEGLEHQAIVGDTPFAGSGLFFVPVEHEGNQSRSLEEAETVRTVVTSLLSGGVRWVDSEGVEHPLRETDILVVAPYNAQVGALTDGLQAGVPVGTVDRFQGQQAPVVIYSTASSSAEDAPRGMEFLFNPNRLNVATSRARCVCILVAAPRLLEPECRTPEQMRWANGLCRYRELAREVAPGAIPVR